jgi:predicted nucleotidyltransferase
VLDLNSVVDVVSRIRGAVGVFLFGSFARGDYDEYSDYDLLVLFEDKALMWQNWDELFQSVGSLKMNLHVIPETLEELKTANPVFLGELFKYGKVLFARFPLEVFSKPVKLELFWLIVYDMSGLSYRDKMKVVYFLYRKGGRGVVAEMGGVRLGDGCVLVPSNVGDEISDKLSALGVNVRKLKICVSEDQFKGQLVNDKPTH